MQNPMKLTKINHLFINDWLIMYCSVIQSLHLKFYTELYLEGNSLSGHSFIGYLSILLSSLY